MNNSDMLRAVLRLDAPPTSLFRSCANRFNLMILCLRHGWGQPIHLTSHLLHDKSFALEVAAQKQKQALCADILFRIFFYRLRSDADAALAFCHAEGSNLIHASDSACAANLTIFPPPRISFLDHSPVHSNLRQESN